MYANVNGPNNAVPVSDAVPPDAPVGSPKNFYGNAFCAMRTKLATKATGWSDYDGAVNRTREIAARANCTRTAERRQAKSW